MLVLFFKHVTGLFTLFVGGMTLVYGFMVGHAGFKRFALP